MDILTWENLSSILVANMDLIYWTVCSFRRRGVDWARGGRLKPEACFTSLEYMTIWCNIQVIIYPSIFINEFLYKVLSFSPS